MVSKQNKSFTLIEMLIVVVIIGILAAALIPRLQSVQARARDTKRKADLRQIGTALAIYKEDNGGYNAMKDRNVESLVFPLIDYNNYGVTSDRLYPMIQLERYMTAIPADSDQSTRSPTNGYDSSQGSDQMRGYALVILSRRGNWSTNGPRDSSMLVARTESDGSSSNWVTKTNSDGTTTSDLTGSDGWWGATNGVSISASIYDQYQCATVVFSGVADNSLQGACSANKDGNDLRYIYVQ